MKKLSFSIQERLLLAFSVFTAIIIILTGASFLFLRKANQIKNIKHDIEELHLKTINLILRDNEFFNFEIINNFFYETGHSRYLDRRNILFQEMRLSLHMLHDHPEFSKYGLAGHFAQIEKHLNRHDSVFRIMVDKMYQRGFKDYGLEGKMRAYIHALEFAQDRKVPMEDILQLRRHEKDYFLRSDETYYQALLELADDIGKKLKIDDPVHQEQAEMMISYVESFKKVVQLEKEIGLYNQTGLKNELNVLNAELSNDFETVSQIASEKEKLMINNVRLNYGALVVVSIILALILSYITSRKLSYPITRLAEDMDNYQKGDLERKPILEQKSSIGEVNYLTEAFFRLVDKIEEQYSQINENSRVLSIQNEELQEANKKLKSWSQQLKASNSVKDKFFSIIAHDLKGPIATIISFLNILINYSDGFSRDEIQKLAIEMQKSITNLNNLLENLLQWSRAQMGSVRFEPKIFELRPLIVKSLELLSKNAREKNIELILPDNIDYQIEGDPNMIDFIIRNLISNAIKFTQKGGEVRVIYQSTDEFLYVHIIDNGVGITKEDQKKLFRDDVFITRYGTAQEKGTGLGLMLCQEFVSKNRGRIWVESEPGTGSKFSFTIPLAVNLADSSAKT